MSTIKNQTIAGVLAGVILLAVPWVREKLADAFHWAKTLAGEAADLLGTKVELTYGDLVLMIAATVFLVALAVAFAWATRTSNKQSERSPAPSFKSSLEAGPKPAVNLEEINLTDNEARLFMALVLADGAWKGVSQLASRSNLKNLLVEREIESLVVKGLASVERSGLYGPVYRTSDLGVEYAIKHDLL